MCNQSIRVAGDLFTTEIQQYMRHQHNIKIGERTAEDIKICVGAALSDLNNQPEPMLVRGPNLMTALPVEVAVTSQEIAHCLDKSLVKIETAVLSVLEQTPPELYSDIVQRGIFLTGEGHCCGVSTNASRTRSTSRSTFPKGPCIQWPGERG